MQSSRRFNIKCQGKCVSTERDLFEQWWFRDTPAEYRADLAYRVRDQGGYVAGTRAAAAWDGWQGARLSQAWIPTAQHCPTRQDADRESNVLAWSHKGYSVVARYEEVTQRQSEYTHWIPLPGAPED